MGHQIRFTARVVAELLRTLDGGRSNVGQRRREAWTLLMQVVVSLAVLVICVLVLTRSDSSESLRFASGLLGVVIGYWLH